MDDDSDDGTLPGQSFFKNKINEKEEYENNEIGENDDYNDNNYNNQNYENEENYENENNDGNYHGDYADNNFENFENNNYYKEDEEQEDYNYKHENDNEANNNNSNYYNNSYNNNYYNKNRYNNYNNKYKKHFNNNYHSYPLYNSIKTKESYITSFLINFKLWLMIIIKTASSHNKNIIFSKNEKINKEIIDSFLKNYEIESNKLKEDNNLKIKLKDFKINHTVGRNYNVEFLIIIKDKIKVFFVKKYIEIKVEGEIYFDKFPKFYFVVNKYELSLNYKSMKNKNDDENNNNKNILEINEPDKNSNFPIGMCPDYTINNPEFRQNYLEINREKNIKDPQKEIRECLDNLIMKYKC